ncbi:DNAJ heat shock N-terminal domain-containing protein [Tieghemostelium lacteum]|uniref:DNAJ heat shock N-terminal domain-containing protein n=1 Tax=Tieghemostelium lacteum TaxID=361077 RepID=A0A151ZA76_TIELA|nr:DNAJ heat shock N-terminal domain-containing protein [Tieghemostelium lacteum]|eukprot:KYQ90823.1 DNAJ heat shock N-terminal domain-containing protein [Tieghemostelium lacteum]
MKQQVDGDDLFKGGKYDQSLEKFTSAIDMIGSDNENQHIVNILFKRAGIYQIKGKNILALSDVNRAIEINPTNFHAKIKRAKIQTSLGRFQQAIEEYENILKTKPDNSMVKKSLDEVKSYEKSLSEAKELIESKKYQESIVILTKILEKISDLKEARLLRCQCNYYLGEYRKAMDDTMSILKSEPTSIDALYWRGRSFFSFGEKDAAMRFLKEALKFDPENQKSKDMIQLIAKFEKSSANAQELFNQQRYDDALGQVNQALDIEPKNPTFSPGLLVLKCKILLKLKKAKDSIQACSLAIELDDQNVDAYLNRGEAWMFEEDYQKALNDFNKAKEYRPNDGTIHEAIRRATKAQKMEARKDYYKILGVTKSATEGEIKKAFKTLARTNHPDKVPTEEREMAEKRYMDINEAYEVLSDQEKRDKYDRGEDLQEMHQGHHGGGFPFNPFGGGFGQQHHGFGGQQGGGGFHYTFNFG